VITGRTESALFVGTFVNPVPAPLATSYGIATDGITSITLTFDPGTIVSGDEYYRSGTTYNFDVAVTANGHSWNCVSNLTLTIPKQIGLPMVFSIAPNGGGGTVNDTNGSGESLTYSSVGTFNNFIITFVYDPTDGLAGVNSTAAARSITASSTSIVVGGIQTDDPPDTTYGITTGLDSVTVSVITGANTTLINGQPYFRPSDSYVFDVAIVANGHNITDITDVTMTIPGTPITLSTNPNVLTVTGTGVAIWVPGVTGSAVLSGVYPNFTVTFTYIPNWSNWTVGEVGVALRNITATATSIGTPLSLVAASHNYGMCTSAKIVTLSHDLDAADGYINPWTSTFNVNGNFIYNILGATAPVDNIKNTDVTANLELLFDIDNNMIAGHEFTDVDSNLDDVSTNASFSINVPAAWFATNGQANNGIGTYDWNIRTTVGTVPRIFTPTTTLSLVCDKYRIQDIQFQNGGGYNGNALTTGYNRNIYTPGTQMRVQLGLQYQGIVTPVALDVISSYTYVSDVRSTNLTVAAGSAWSGWSEITNPLGTEVAAGTTLTFLYNNAIDSILDPSGIYSGGTGQNVVGRISVQDPSPPTILWDNLDPPTLVTTPVVDTVNITVDTVPISWVPIAASLAIAGDDADFYTYRIYYKPTALTAWTVIDLNTPSYAFLGNIATAAFNLINLQALTAYDIYITAVDVFGNETAFGGNASATTLPSTSYVTISDGITSYADATFTADPLPSARPLLDAAIRVEVNIVGATQPDELYVILMDDAEPTPYNPPGGTYYRIALIKTSPNTWAGHISSENLLITPTQNCKFILEAVQDGVSVYYDHDSEIDSDPNTYPWTFTIVNPLVVIPWPTRVLNNVITDKNPVAYPAYYLTDDANVTITAYDIKGRIVAILLDNAPRKSGINIRENGWRGTNKSGRKLGVGLYYLHIKAKRHSDGKVIIDKFNKVVMVK
jgi:hypothetical protein